MKKVILRKTYLPTIFLFLSLFPVFLISCGESSDDTTDTTTTTTTEDGEDSDDDGNTVNTDKLIGTPFEGLTEGDDLNSDLFLCGKYRTETIDSFPIKIFAAFFTNTQEEYVQQGIDLANDGMDFTAYELTDTWSDDVRVIYKYNDLDVDEEASGKMYGMYFNYNGNLEAEKESPDWAVAIDDGIATLSGLDGAAGTVAHELGHASGIRSHALIDYVNDTIVDFNDADSIMDAPSGTDTPDYNFMMSMQGQIMTDHLGEAGGQVSGPSDSECESLGLGN